MIDVRVNKKSLNLPQVCGLMEELRELTLTAIEEIGKWRGRTQIDPNDDTYGNTVLHKVSTDVDFLRSSPLRKHIEFSNSNDPLFLYPLRKFWNLKLVSNFNNRSVMNLFEVPLQLKERLLKAEKVLKGGDLFEEASSDSLLETGQN